jgi:hypothetical protein
MQGLLVVGYFDFKVVHCRPLGPTHAAVGSAYNGWMSSVDLFLQRVRRRLGAFAHVLENERVRTEVMQAGALYRQGYYSEKELERYLESLIRKARGRSARRQTPKQNRKYVAK